MEKAAGPFQAEMPRFIRSNALAFDRQDRGYMNRANAACTLFQCILFSPAAEALIWVNVMCQSIASASEKVVCVLTPQDEGTQPNFQVSIRLESTALQRSSYQAETLRPCQEITTAYLPFMS